MKKHLSIIMIALFLLSFAPTNSVVAAELETSEIKLNAGVAPTFVSVSPAEPTYGYALNTVVTITYDAPLGNTTKLRGSGAGLSWDTGLAATTATDNATYTTFTFDLTLNETVQFKGVSNGADWESGDNHMLSIEGGLGYPDFVLAESANTIKLDDSGNGLNFFVPENETVTLWMSVLNEDTTGDYYMVGDFTGWDITNKTFAFTYFNTSSITAGTNISYWKIDYDMSSRIAFKVGAFGDWGASESGDNNGLQPTLFTVSKPVLHDVVGATLERTRNDDDAVNEGAKYRTTIGNNVTIWYKVYTTQTCGSLCVTNFTNYVQTKTMELQGDDAGKTLDWDVNGNVSMTFVNVTVEDLTGVADVQGGSFNGLVDITGAAVAYFKVIYTVVLESAQIKGNFDGDWEGYDFSANNLIVAGIDWTSSLVGDVYNVGTFTIRFSAEFATENTANPDVLSFGIYNGADWTETNYTGSIGAPLSNGTWVIDMEINAADYNLVAGTEGNAQAILYHYDLGLMKYTKAYDPAGSHSFTPMDGAAGGTLVGDADQGLAATMAWTATSGANSTVASATMDWGDGSTAEALTGSAGNATHTYTTDGSYNVTLTVTTVAGGSYTMTKEITVDGTAPTATFETPAVDGLVVTFKFAITDALSGVKSAVIDFGDGKTVDVTTSTSVIHTFAEAKSFTVKLTATDNAGNSASVTVTVDLTALDVTDVTSAEPPSFVPGFTAIISIIGLGSLFVLRRRK